MKADLSEFAGGILLSEIANSFDVACASISGPTPSRPPNQKIDLSKTSPDAQQSSQVKTRETQNSLSSPSTSQASSSTSPNHTLLIYPKSNSNLTDLLNEELQPQDSPYKH
ncbi:hypothetical protein AVEN_89529-1 [Araneus ventricosus]|uniref:Uncharacterized protein n=1 Tax=Araneus ventricosus TaxID=182803 RepID=A0A4Y2KIV2_ARAVE|nr:hypothetical protein AVEN_89529-1 [Araneus ventricosus]